MNILKQSSFSLLLAGMMAIFLSACSEDMQRGLQPVPTAFGKINQIEILIDEDMWEGPVGDTLRFYYSGAYPILPQPEPIFDLRAISPKQLEMDPIKKELRNYLIIANLNDQESPTSNIVRKDLGEEKVRKAKEDPTFNSSVGKDKWAMGQLLIYQFGYSEDALIENLKKNFPAIKKRFQDVDRDRIDATVFFNGESGTLKNEVQEKMDAQMRIPNDYVLAISDEEIIWMRKNTPEMSSNLIVSKVAYTDQSQLTKEGIKSIRDSIGKKYISSTLPDTYMRVNDIDLPLFTSAKTLNNNYALEARGIWEIVNDYMGGAFISYLIHNPDKQELLFVDGFVHAPGKDKRDFMQHLEYIISTVEF